MLIRTDLQIRVPEGTYGRIAPRSGLAVNHSIHVGAGVIDPDYTGNVGVVIFNHAKTDFIIKKGDRIAQLICEQYKLPEMQVCMYGEIFDECSPDPIRTERGSGGFGSTGNGISSTDAIQIAEDLLSQFPCDCVSEKSPEVECFQKHLPIQVALNTMGVTSQKVMLEIARKNL